jgi:hypothetical protein
MPAWKPIFPENCKKNKKKNIFFMVSLIAGTNSTMGIYTFVCKCMCVYVYICGIWHNFCRSTNLRVHWLQFYMAGFKSNWWELFWVCLVSIQWSVCAFLQGRCSCHVTYVGIHHHGRRDVSHWVNTGYRPVRFSLTQPQKPIHIAYMSLLLISHLCNLW